MHLVVRPLGGLNDILCTIHRAYLYCTLYSRRLVVHSAHLDDGALFADGIQNYFESLSDSIQLGVSLDDELCESLLDILDSRSSSLSWNAPFATTANRRLIRSLDRGFSDKILLYEGFGGGEIAHNVLSYLRLKNKVKIFISNFLSKLPSKFNAVHCRHTDYRSDLEMLDKQLFSLGAEGLPIYLATDNAALLEHVKSKDYGAMVINMCTTFANAGAPMHHSIGAGTPVVVNELLAELSVLVFSNQFKCPRIVNPSNPLIAKSGLSLLVENLRKIDRSSLLSYFTVVDPVV